VKARRAPYHNRPVAARKGVPARLEREHGILDLVIHLHAQEPRDKVRAELIPVFDVDLLGDDRVVGI